MAQPCLVQAAYSFKGKNNDELCFKKGDVITVTQKEDGGWWEGTLAGLTGWFPSNYVKEHNLQGMVIDSNKLSLSPTNGSSEIGGSQQVAYRSIIVKDLVDSEKAHVAELHTLVSNFLHPLQKSDILSKDEYRQLVGNLDGVIEMHKTLLAGLERASGKPPMEQRVGGFFLQSAPQLKSTHLSYCSSHPRAVCILNKFRDALNTFMESQGAASPGLLVLTTGLSKPFRRMEKYTGILQELERHLEENHPDRGDTQRSVTVYKDIWSTCSITRRKKEQELEVLTGGVRGWEGEELSSLGEIIHMGSVAMMPDHRDRYLVLFPSTLLILSVSPRMSAFIYEGKLPLSTVTVTALSETENVKNAFEIAGPLIEKIVAVCQTKEDQQIWVQGLRTAIGAMRCPQVTVASAAAPQLTTTEVESKKNENIGPWSITSLRPLPPLRPKPSSAHVKVKTPLSPVKSVDSNFEDDIQILRVIELYCGNPLRSSMSPVSGKNNNGRVKSIIHPNASMASKERYVLENIELLRTQVAEMSSKLSNLSSRLDGEVKTRTMLQNTVAMYITDGKLRKPDN